MVTFYHLNIAAFDTATVQLNPIDNILLNDSWNEIIAKVSTWSSIDLKELAHEERFKVLQNLLLAKFESKVINELTQKRKISKTGKIATKVSRKKISKNAVLISFSALFHTISRSNMEYSQLVLNLLITDHEQTTLVSSINTELENRIKNAIYELSSTVLKDNQNIDKDFLYSISEAYAKKIFNKRQYNYLSNDPGNHYGRLISSHLMSLTNSENFSWYRFQLNIGARHPNMVRAQVLEKLTEPLFEGFFLLPILSNINQPDTNEKIRQMNKIRELFTLVFMTQDFFINRYIELYKLSLGKAYTYKTAKNNILSSNEQDPYLNVVRNIINQSPRMKFSGLKNAYFCVTPTENSL